MNGSAMEKTRKSGGRAQAAEGAVVAVFKRPMTALAPSRARPKPASLANARAPEAAVAMET